MLVCSSVYVDNRKAETMLYRRYLLNISYTGKPFRGAQRQMPRTIPPTDDPTTIQGCLEIALKTLKPWNEPKVFLSSRTDTGVHAFNSTCHVDLCRSINQWFPPQSVTVRLNHHFTRHDIPIRILRACFVPNDFSCRSRAVSRTYLYRLAVAKGDCLHVVTHDRLIPIEEKDRCYFICTNSFDLKEMRNAAKLFTGVHDFRTFMGKATTPAHRDKISRKNIFRLDILEGKPMTYSNFSWPSCVNSSIDDYKFFDIYIQADGFLYRQVRRIVGTLIAFAQGKITTRELKCMLQVPSQNSWNPRIILAPACGLYLCEVAYSKEDEEQFCINDNYEL